MGIYKIMLLLLLNIYSPIDISFHDSIFFATRPDGTIMEFTSTDSSYVKAKVDSLLPATDYNRYNYEPKFYYGKFSYYSDFRTPRIDLASNSPIQDTLYIPIWNQAGTEWLTTIEYVPLNDDYSMMFLLTHEVLHYLDYLEAIRLYGKDYHLVREYMRSIPESQVDARAKELYN